MIEAVKPFAEYSAAAMELLGIVLIAMLTFFSLILGVIRLIKKERYETVFDEVRGRVGRGILLGLEFLVGADIIHTVAVELTFKTIGVLAIVVLIRTFLSFTLEVELTGRWPWQKKE
jgi:uncharacterized membrane protein